MFGARTPPACGPDLAMDEDKSHAEFCYLCGRPLSEAPQDVEHVVPKSLFHKKKDLLTLPAHKACNNSYALDDEYFRLCMTVAAIPGNPTAKKVWEGPVMRGFHRPEMPGLKWATLKSLHPIDVHSPAGIYLGTGEAMLQDAPRIQRVVNRITRGLYATRTGKILPLDWPVSSDLIDPAAAKPFFDQLYERDLRLARVGDGAFHYGWAHLEESTREGFFWMIFYETVHFWGYTGTKMKMILNPSQESGQRRSSL